MNIETIKKYTKKRRIEEANKQKTLKKNNGETKTQRKNRKETRKRRNEETKNQRNIKERSGETKKQINKK